MPKRATSSARSRCERETEHASTREGGWGIVVVVAAHLSLAIQSGLLRSGGVLYLSWKEDFDTNDKETGSVLSIFFSLPCFSGLLGGVLTQRFGCRFSGMVGGSLAFIGFLCSHWVKNIVQFYITALVAGLGMGISYNSALVVVALYFKRRYKAAHAVAFSGLGTGIMAVPPLIQFLLGKYGWRGACLVASAIAANCVLLSALFRPNRDQRNSRKTALCQRVAQTETRTRSSVSGDEANELESLRRDDDELEVVAGDEEHEGTPFEVHCVRNAREAQNSNPVLNLLKRLSDSLGLYVLARSYRFTALCVIQVQYSVGFVGFLVYLDPRAQSVGVTPHDAAILLSIYGVGSLLGRLGNGLLLGWRISSEHVTAVFMVLAGVSSLLLNWDNHVAFAIASFLQGFATGFHLAVVVILIRHFVGVKKLAVSIGINQMFVGVGSLLGPVFAGWILDVAPANYHTVFYVLGGAYLLCAAQMFLLPLLRRIEPGMAINSTDV